VDGADPYGFFARSWDGGYTWEYEVSAQLDVGATGYSSLWACGINQFFAVGDTETTGYIVEIGAPQPTLV